MIQKLVTAEMWQWEQLICKGKGGKMERKGCGREEGRK
jgi:hypothetical protein